MSKQELIEEIGEALYDELQHNRITTEEELDNAIAETLADAFNVSMEDTRMLYYQVYDCMYNKYNFGFCDICGKYINYNEGGWVDMATLEPLESQTANQNMARVLKAHGEPSDHLVQDICMSCLYELKGEEE